ncbi:unnamed protein product [Rotaria sp. Silwood2]|nr:unnamed protein product [Rotaria sp. Silwood2]CAF4741715.1 unnamed protein product [Rotaria sp. Silwood2]
MLEQETTEQEFNFLQQQIDHYNSPSQSFENSFMAQSTTINSLENPVIRQQLFGQYKAIAEQSKAQLAAFYMTMAKKQRDECKKKYDDEVKKLWSNCRAIVDDEKLPLLMVDLINERCRKISECIQSIYKYKAQSISSKSNK